MERMTDADRAICRAMRASVRCALRHGDRADTDRMSRWRRDRLDGSLLTPAMSAEEDRQEYEQS